MNEKKYNIGKRVGHVWYFHRNYLPRRYRGAEVTRRTPAKTPALIKGWNIIKVDQFGYISYLKYRRFMSDDFPELEWSVKVVPGQKSRKITYDSDNPPIFHRKELLIPEDHPAHMKAKKLTRKCEDAGLFKDTKKIGRKKPWQALLNSM